jgi:hypothetical protein
MGLEEFALELCLEPLVESTIRLIWDKMQRNRVWNEIIGREDFWSNFSKPEFLKDCQIVLGTLRDGKINEFDERGVLRAVNNLSLEYPRYLAEAIGKKPILGILSKHLKLEGRIEKLEKRIGKRTLQRRMVKGDTNRIISIGGPLPNPLTEEIIRKKDPDLTFADAKNPQPIDSDMLNEIRRNVQSAPDEEEKLKKQPNWGIAIRKGNKLEPLITPRQFETRWEGEKSTPFEVDGGLIIFIRDKGKYYLVLAGARKSATAVLPGIINYPHKFFEKEDLNKIKEAIGNTQKTSFVAAVEINFIRKPKCRHSSIYRWDNPPQLCHIDYVKIKDVQPL